MAIGIPIFAAIGPGVPGLVSPIVTGIPWLAWFGWLALGFFAIFPGIVAYIVWAERKVAGRFQDRIGPNRVGPFGLLQPIADFIKLIIKEDLVPDAADRWVFWMAPFFLIVSAFLTLAVMPFGFGRLDEAGQITGFIPVDLPAGLLYLIAAGSLSSLGIFLAGWSSRNKYALIGSMRGVAQLVSYEVPQVLSVVPVLLWASSLSLVRILDLQVQTGFWNVFAPAGALAFALLTISSIAEINRTPFDLPEAESEIIAGFHTEYSGMRFGLFFLAEYESLFVVSCLGTVLFLGGGSLPFIGFPYSLLGDSTGSIILANLLALAIFAVKVAGFIFLIFWIRATLPRMRVDQLMHFAWKWLIPLSLLNIINAAVWYELVIRPAEPRFWLGWLATAVLVGLSLILVAWLNHGQQSVPGAGPDGKIPSQRDSGTPLRIIPSDTPVGSFPQQPNEILMASNARSQP